MRNFHAKEIKTMFSGFCCSRCKNDFDIESITVKKKIKDIYICNLSCQKCGKDFGDIVFKFNSKSNRHPALQVIDGPEPITFNDVIDAHNYIKHHM